MRVSQASIDKCFVKDAKEGLVPFRFLPRFGNAQKVAEREIKQAFAQYIYDDKRELGPYACSSDKKGLSMTRQWNQYRRELFYGSPRP